MSARLPAGSGPVVGIGDDAAGARAPDARVVATTDLLLEGRHFRRDWSAALDVGRKAAARNLADIAGDGRRSRPRSSSASRYRATCPAAWAQDLVPGSRHRVRAHWRVR